jgi:hypothetical protein
MSGSGHAGDAEIGGMRGRRAFWRLGPVVRASALVAPRAPALRHTVAAAPLVAALLVILVGGYGMRWGWTGYRSRQGPLTLWDWLSASLFPLTLALTPLWLRSRGRHRRTWGAAVLVLSGVLLVLLVGGYVRDWAWTGFTGNTLWDWVKLFIVPFLLPFVFQFLAGDTDSGSHPRAPGGRHADRVSSRSALVERIAPLAGSSVLALSLVAALGLILPGRPVTTSQTRPAGCASTSAGAGGACPGTGVTWVTVDSRNPRWTDVHLHVRSGARIQIDGSGQVLPSPKKGYRWASPAGLPAYRRGQASIDTAIGHAALIATIAAHEPAPLRDTRAGSVIDVGVHRSLVAPRSGEVFLGVNDKKTDDNDGWYAARVDARPPAPPGP